MKNVMGERFVTEHTDPDGDIGQIPGRPRNGQLDFIVLKSSEFVHHIVRAFFSCHLGDGIIADGPVSSLDNILETPIECGFEIPADVADGSCGSSSEYQDTAAGEEEKQKRQQQKPHQGG